MFLAVHVLGWPEGALTIFFPTKQKQKKKKQKHKQKTKKARGRGTFFDTSLLPRTHDVGVFIVAL